MQRRMIVRGSGAIALLLGIAACASSTTQPPEAKNEPHSRSGFTAEQDAHINACYEASLPRHPGLAVNTVGFVVGRGEKVLLADVHLPESPELARCIVDKLAGTTVPQPPGSADGAVWTGGIRVVLGGPAPVARLSLRESKDRLDSLLLEGRRRGLLRDSDRMVDELLHPRPAWPTTEQNAQLDECYRAQLREHPGLVVHANASYIAKGNKILLADVPTPEVPALGRCLAEKIVTWTAPFSGDREDAVLSGFLVHLGAPPEFPDGTRHDPLARRDALVLEAVRRRVLSSTDPLVLMVEADRARRGDAGVSQR